MQQHPDKLGDFITLIHTQLSGDLSNVAAVVVHIACIYRATYSTLVSGYLLKLFVDDTTDDHCVQIQFR